MQRDFCLSLVRSFKLFQKTIDFAAIVNEFKRKLRVSLPEEVVTLHLFDETSGIDTTPVARHRIPKKDRLVKNVREVDTSYSR
jgi:hypothetical protein